MGNCVLKGYSSSPPDHQVGAGAADQDHHQQQMMIKIVTANGAIMELYAPITADQITSEFPGHALFRSPDPAHSDPLLRKDSLHPGHLYYLLPLSAAGATAAASPTASDAMTPYRISVDDPRVEWKGSDPDRYRGRNHKGVWKVRLVINPEQLSEILSQDSRTEELIESVRAVAKCGGANTSVTTSAARAYDSDDSSVLSTCNFHWKAYVKNTTQPKVKMISSTLRSQCRGHQITTHRPPLV